MIRDLNIKTMTLLLFSVLGFKSMAQFSDYTVTTTYQVVINGDTAAMEGETKTYLVSSIYGGTAYTNQQWSVIGGTIISQTTTSVTIKWGPPVVYPWGAPMNQVSFSAQSSYNNNISNGFLRVNVSNPGPQHPPTPNPPSIHTQNCTSAELTVSGSSALEEVIWYWQGTNATGTSTSSPATSNYPVTASGTYYLRALNTNSGLWSEISSSVTVSLGTIGGPTWYDDSSDGDGLGDPNTTLTQCTPPLNYVSNADDLCPNEFGTLNNGGCPLNINLSNENYIYTVIPQIPTTNVDSGSVIYQDNKYALKQVTYFDGLGRPMQQLAIKQSAITERDIITHIDYDAVGRQDKDYLPYVPDVIGNDASYRTEALTATESFYNVPNYNNTTNPYAQKEFEASPLNRVFKQAAPGEDWKLGSGHEIRLDYQTNTHNPDTPNDPSLDNVRLYNVNLDITEDPIIQYTPTLVDAGFYHTGELYKSITKDENWTEGKLHTTEEFKNKQGQIILKRTYALVATNNTDPSQVEAHDTYYVYDSYGNLSYVLPPKADTTDGLSQEEIDRLCYQYTYDHRNRLATKKIPGKDDWEYIVYDQLDRPVLVQDPNLRNTNQWLFTKYDVFGRVAYTGLYTHSSTLSQPQMQELLATQNSTADQLFEIRRTPGYDGSDYTNNNFPRLNTILQTVTYYDDYDFDLAGSFNPNTTPTQVYGVTTSTQTKGLVTGSKVKENAGSSIGDDWITTVVYYDPKGRPIYEYKKGSNFINTTDIVQSKLDFVGRVLETTSTHTVSTWTDPTPITTTTIDRFEYDHAGRLLSQTQTIGNHTERIAHNNYNELGELSSKNVGGAVTETGSTAGAGLQTVDYTYNIRGWLKQINNTTNIGDDLFAFKLGYNEGDTPLYNGNIALAQWKTNNVDNSLKTYNYSYDALNRITKAIDDNTGHYNLNHVSYDKNGNITSLKRMGVISEEPTTAFGVMDDLSYTYQSSSNKLTQVKESPEGSPSFGFKEIDTNATGPDYTYDANGNMKSDANKEITNIDYNHLNLPVMISFSNGSKIQYFYDATGTKTRKQVGDVSVGQWVATVYRGNYVYEYVVGSGEPFPAPKFIHQPEGYIEPTSNGGYKYVYQYKDHLGNIRLSYADNDNNGSIDPNTEIIEENNYYPFGLKHKGYNDVFNGTDHKYGFGGKEEQDELGLGWIDITARNYDPALGRWMNVDPLAELMRRHSPYNYAFNNPVFFIDYDGLAPTSHSACNDCNKYVTGEDFLIGYFDNNGDYQTYNYTGGEGPLPDNKFVQSFVEAYRYNVNNGGGNSMKAIAENKNITVTVSESNAESFTEYNKAGVNHINWNPNAGVETDNGTVLSPATVVEHESSHALDNANGKSSEMQKPDIAYGKLGERNAITGPEQLTAKANRELKFGTVSTRLNHDGIYVYTDGPTSTNVNKAKTRELTKEIQNNNEWYNPDPKKYKHTGL